jgi:hypothetical protein
MPRRPAFASLVVAAAISPAFAADKVDYLRDVKPVLTARCYACHGALQQKAGLRVDTARELLDAEAVIPGKSGDSPLVAHITERKGFNRMPPASEGEGLTPAQIATIRRWIDQGAIAPPNEQPDPDPREHWAFRAPVRPKVPSAGNPVDALLAAAWRKHGLAPQRPAEKRLLLRRVYLDLVGMPPTPEEAEAFLSDTSPDAYAKVVDKLLASPRYGERWGRHFMDIWRYSDWWGLGAEVRNSQKHMWHWRDWIIESLNADKGYDQMVREMLAADELYPTDPDKLRATGYLARSYFLFNRTTWLDDTLSHTAKAFLGLTFNCAKCHDHKYDPIRQDDYYRLRAIFEPYQIRTDMVPGETDFARDGIPRAFDCNLTVPTYKHERGDESRPIKTRSLSPGIPALLAFAEFEPKPVKLPPAAYMPQLQPWVRATQERDAAEQVAAARATAKKVRTAVAVAGAAAALGVPTVDAALTAAEANAAAIAPRFAAEWAKCGGAPAEAAAALAHEAARAEAAATRAKAVAALEQAEWAASTATKKKAAAARKTLDAARKALAAARKAAQSPGVAYAAPRGSSKSRESNVETEASRTRPFPRTSTGRRTALANWITDRRNPLAARVIANHVWARHFGKPLVATVFDFGRKGAKPTHPELLDWLAVELMDHGWSLKHLHRVVVTSRAYRMSSSNADSPSASRDPENKYLWRQNPVRMEAQAVRDSLLQLAGKLDPKLGGPSVPLAQQDTSRRRGLYFVHSHNDHHKFLSQFDDANVLECYRRDESIVPQQALTLSNSKFALTMADAINQRLHARLGNVTDAQFVTAAFELVLGDTPSADELAACQGALAEWQSLLRAGKHADPVTKSRANLIAALVNHNDFVTVR